MSSSQYLVLRDIRKESLLLHLPKMLSGDLSAANCKMCSPLFSLYHNHPKDRVFLYANFQPEGNVSVQDCHMHEHKGVFSYSMLHCDQGKRASAEKALCSPFFSIPFGKLWLWPLLRTLSACVGSSTDSN